MTQKAAEEALIIQSVEDEEGPSSESSHHSNSNSAVPGAGWSPNPGHPANFYLPIPARRSSKFFLPSIPQLDVVDFSRKSSLLLVGFEWVSDPLKTDLSPLLDPSY